MFTPTLGRWDPMNTIITKVLLTVPKATRDGMRYLLRLVTNSRNSAPWYPTWQSTALQSLLFGVDKNPELLPVKLGFPSPHRHVLISISLVGSSPLVDRLLKTKNLNWTWKRLKFEHLLPEIFWCLRSRYEVCGRPTENRQVTPLRMFYIRFLRVMDQSVWCKAFNMYQETYDYIPFQIILPWEGGNTCTHTILTKRKQQPEMQTTNVPASKPQVFLFSK